MSFLDEGGRLIRVLQQPVTSSDDADFSPVGGATNKGRSFSPEVFESYGRALLARTLEPLGLPFAFVFHPGNFCTFANGAETRFLRAAAEAGAALLSDYDWLDFWQMRRSWRLTAVSSEGSHARFRYAGDAARGLAVSLPATWAGRTASVVRADGQAAAVRQIEHFGEKRVLVGIPDGRSEAEIEVEYPD